MFRYLVALHFVFISYSVNAQKPLIDTSSFRTWIFAEAPHISSDGKYVSYDIRNKPLNGRTTVLQSADGSFQKEFIGITLPRFSEDAKYFLYRQKGQLFIFKLKERVLDSLPAVKNIHLVKSGEKEWLVYINDEGLIIQDLQHKRKELYKNVIDYSVSSDGNKLAIVDKKKNSPDLYNIELVDLRSFDRQSIWLGKSPSNIIFSNDAKQLAFLMEAPKGQIGKSVGYFKKGMDQAVRLNEIDSLCRASGASIKPIIDWDFSEDGTVLMFSLEQQNNLNDKKRSIRPDIWSDKDTFLQSVQLDALGIAQTSLYSIDVAAKRIILLTGPGERVQSSAIGETGKILFVQQITGYVGEYYWNPLVGNSNFLVFANTGKRIYLNRNDQNIFKNLQLSPDARYAIYYNISEGNYFSYNIKTGVTRNITKDIKVPWSFHETRYSMYDYTYPIGIEGWLADNSILINSRYDIWKADPEGKVKPVNLTYTGDTSVIYCLAVQPKAGYINGKDILVKAFNLETKECGFYKLVIDGKTRFSKLSMGQFIYETRGLRQYAALSDVADLVKASKAQAYLVCRQDAEHSPNFFFTKDFVSFQQVSDVHPERNYNWITSELHSFELPNGSKSQAILYKPENFDPNKLYPVVFYFYERLSDKLNEFKPVKTTGGMNFVIPYFVSNGYLVCMPDIIFSKRPGASALMSVEAAARYLMKQSFVDSSRMGISGHSFGGYEANYIATHSKLFNAVASGAGIANLVSFYGSIYGGVGKWSLNSMLEDGQFKMNNSIWGDVNAYIKESPIFYADKVIAPVLLMHNKEDENVGFSQSLEFFTALRRLKKEVWLLQYDGEKHFNLKTDNKLDITIRIKQFFDHYLKNTPAPKWISTNMPASSKGIDDGLMNSK